jgi:dihydroxyacetone kinase DhaKLM complex PTS-EIIA-like component DhaM
VSNAPLVEGAIIAAVEAAIGADLARVAEVAEQTSNLRKLHV